jgi:hypothetical protein
VTATGIRRGLARIAAILVGIVCLLAMTVMTLGGALIVGAVVGAAYAISRRRGRSLTLLQSWFVTVVTTAIILSAGLGWFMTMRDKNGSSYWHGFMMAMDTADRHPAPPPRVLRYLPGANVQPRPLPKAAKTPLTVFGIVMGVELIGILYGSLTWGAGWLLVSGWTGRLAGAKTVDAGRAGP